MVDLEERMGMDYGLDRSQRHGKLRGSRGRVDVVPGGGCREREESEVYTYSYGIFFSRWMDPIDPSNIYAFLKSKKNLISLHRLEASAGRGD